MTTTLAIPGTILKGRNRSNPDTRAKVWMIHPTNPRRVLLWMKTERFSWNNVSSLDVNYETAPADEPTWPDPTREPPPDVPRGSKRSQTPVESIAAAPESVPTVDTSADDGQDDEPAPSPPPAPPVDEESMAIVLYGDDAALFRTQLTFLNNAARMTGGQPLTPAALATTAVARLVAGLMGGAA